MPEERAQQLQRFEKVAHGQGVEILTQPCFFFLVFIFTIWLRQVLLAACRILNCSIWDLIP